MTSTSLDETAVECITGLWRAPLSRRTRRTQICWKKEVAVVVLIGLDDSTGLDALALGLNIAERRHDADRVVTAYPTTTMASQSPLTTRIG